MSRRSFDSSASSSSRHFSFDALGELFSEIIPCVQLPKTVVVVNARISVLYCIFQAAMLIFAVWSFVSSKKYTSIISNGPTLTVSFHTPGFRVLQEYQETGGHHCEVDEWTKISTLLSPGPPSTYYNIKCVPYCGPANPFDCLDFADLIYMPTPIMSATTLSRDIVKLGSHVVLPPTGLPAPSDTAVVESQIHPYAEAALFVFEYSYMLTESVPWFFGAEADVSRTGTNIGCRTVVLDKNGFEFKSFEPDSQIVMSVSEMFFCTHGPRLISPHLTENAGQVVVLSYAQNPDRLPSYLYFQGGTVFAQVDCYADLHDIDNLDSVRLSDATRAARVSASTPICLLKFNMASSEMVNSKLVKHTPNETIRTVDKSFAVLCKDGQSFHRIVDFNAIVLNVTSALVLLVLPLRLMRLIVTHLLGHLSTVYRSVLKQRFCVREECGKAVSQIVANSLLFENMADLQLTDGAARVMSKEQFLKSVILAAQGDVLDEEEAQVLAEVGFKHSASTFLDADPAITCDRFVGQLTSVEIQFQDVLTLFDKDRRPCFSERLFTPSDLFQAIHTNKGTNYFKESTASHLMIGSKSDIDHEQKQEMKRMREDFNKLLNAVKELGHEVSRFRAEDHRVSQLEADVKELKAWRREAGYATVGNAVRAQEEPIPDDLSSHISDWSMPSDQSQLLRKTLDKKKLSISVLSASGLRNADSFGGKSDPYCTIEMQDGKGPLAKTNVKFNTCDPQWNEHLILEDYVLGQSIVFKVWDKDYGKADDFLGTAKVTSNLFLKPGGSGILELHLIKAGEGVDAALKVIIEVQDLQETSEEPQIKVDASILQPANVESRHEVQCQPHMDVERLLNHKVSNFFANAQRDDAPKLPHPETEAFVQSRHELNRFFEVFERLDSSENRCALNGAFQEELPQGSDLCLESRQSNGEKHQHTEPPSPRLSPLEFNDRDVSEECKTKKPLAFNEALRNVVASAAEDAVRPLICPSKVEGDIPGKMIAL